MTLASSPRLRGMVCKFMSRRGRFAACYHNVGLVKPQSFRRAAKYVKQSDGEPVCLQQISSHNVARAVKDDADRHSQLATWGEHLSTCGKPSTHEQLAETVQALHILVEQGCYVDSSLLYRALRGCVSQKNLFIGSRVHALTVESGYESNALLASQIISMYASHGRLKDAMHVFSKVAAPNTFTWYSIISAHAEHEEPTQAINLYRQMRQSTVKPNSYVIVSVLKACASTADLRSGKEVHADILGSAVETDIFVSNNLVNMYAKCGSLEDARRVFDRLTTRDVVTWNAMMGGYVQHGLSQQALDLYSSMQREALTPAGRVTFVCLVQACASLGALHQGQQLHAQIQKQGLEDDVVVGSALVDMYAKCGSLEDARAVFDQLPNRNIVTWNSMIAGYARHGLGQEALALYASMQRDDMTSGDHVTHTCLLQACASARALHEGRQLHVQIQERGLESDVVVANSLIDMYAKCGCLEDARRVFDRLPTRTIVTWNAMITGYTQHGLGQEALALYASMQQDSLTRADHVTFVCLLQACGGVGALYQGKHLHAEIQRQGLDACVVIGNCLVDMYAKCGSLGDAQSVFDRLPTRDVMSWTALLNGYAVQSRGRMAILCFEEMRQQGVEPDGATFVCLLVACSHEALVDEGKKYFKMMVEDYGIGPTISHYNCMVDLLGRSGHLDEAESMLGMMPFQSDAVGWTSLLCACKSHGDIDRGVRCFNHLVTLEPDNATAYMLLANLYANAGRWKEVDGVEDLRKLAGAWKKPAKACIEVKNKVHEFAVGEERADVSTKLRSMKLKLKDGGHVPHTELVLKALPETEKEDALCGHAEKLALAYGLITTSDSTTLLVTKNLRMCNDCHSSTKVMSRLERREIIVRDAHRVHRFVDGSCSCGDRH